MGFLFESNNDMLKLLLPVENGEIDRTILLPFSINLVCENCCTYTELLFAAKANTLSGTDCNIFWNSLEGKPESTSTATDAISAIPISASTFILELNLLRTRLACIETVRGIVFFWGLSESAVYTLLNMTV